MEIPLRYKITSEMLSLISQIEVKKTLLETIEVSSELVKSLQRRSLLKSSLFSAKIEGNTLEASDLDSLTGFDPKLKERMEIENILSGFLFIRKQKTIDVDFVLGLHKVVMKELSQTAGFLRKEPSAIFNQSGFAVYVAPAPSQVPGFLSKLISYIQKDTKENVFIKAAVSHICFEKIHPFLDGNGRVGRLLLWKVLIDGGYSFNGLISIEEALNERKEEYYAYLDKNDATSFIEFMLEVVNDQAQKTLSQLKEGEFKKEDLLLPRRKEILEIIRDHEIVSLDFLRRRFLRISDRMIRYDLKKLELSGYIVKLGTTRAARYRLK